MYLELAVLAAFLLMYSSVAGGVELREDIDTELKPGMVVSMEPMVMLPEEVPGAGEQKNGSGRHDEIGQRRRTRRRPRELERPHVRDGAQPVRHARVGGPGIVVEDNSAVLIAAEDRLRVLEDGTLEITNG